MARLEHTNRSNDDQPDWSDFETKVGVELASIFDSLAIVRDQECRVSSSPLRGLARNLVELFGPTVGDITLMTSIDCLALPALQHRAFILMANELIMNALLHAFKGRHSGRLSLELSVSNRSFARLVMTDDGNGLAATMNHRPAQCSVIAYLADLLQSELVYRQAVDGGTIAEIDIPL
jgi:two-component sensor histidine kinase